MSSTPNIGDRQAQVAGPPFAVRRWRYLIGFIGSVVLGVASHLPLRDLVPQDAQIAIPFSAALMGVVAVCIEFFGFQELSSRWLRRWFKRDLVLVLVGFTLFTLVYTRTVQRVDTRGGKASSRILVGFTRPDKFPCTRDVSDAECIGNLTLDPSKISSFWGDQRIRFAEFALVMSYALFTSGFGLLVGLVVLAESFVRGGVGRVPTVPR